MRGRATLRRLAVAALVANVLIVVSGGAVRLTGSGLGCPTVPRCTPESLVPTRELGVHGAIEFGNRMLTWVLGLVVLLTLLAAVRQRPRRVDDVLLAAALLVGIPVQAVIGAITVLTDLNPWVVTLHFAASMVLIGAATVLVRRTGPQREPARTPVPRPLRQLTVAQLALLGAVVYAGTVVTASGPHAGDRDAKRTGLDLESVAQLHADGVFLLVGLSVALLAGLRAVRAAPGVVRAQALLVALELGQALVGFVQYATDLPVLLVGLHMLGAALLVAAATDVVLAAHPQPAAVPPRPRQETVTATAPASRSPAPSG